MPDVWEMNISALKSNKAWTRIKISPLMKTLQNAARAAHRVNQLHKKCSCLLTSRLTEVVSCRFSECRFPKQQSVPYRLARALCKVTNWLRSTMRASRMLKGFSSGQLFRSCLASGSSAAADAPSAHFRSQQVWLIGQLVSQLAEPCLRLLMSSGGTRTLWYVRHRLGTVSRAGGCCQWIYIAMLPF